ncbi:MAG: hypothetical protein H7322_07195 [Ramlibacter sp.]|nr:hypothetical protein [Ramlibacter sp.]
MPRSTPPETCEFTEGAHERVTGPFKGYHVASVGCHVSAFGGGYLGYYKVVRGHPDNYWTADSVLEGRCNRTVSTATGAMHMAECAAARLIRGMAANSPNAGWGYGCGSMMPFLREQREARAGNQFRGTAPSKIPL